MPRRAEFSKLTKARAFERCAGRCECGCGLRIQGTPEYDHIIPAAIGGSADLDNCQVLDPKCHRRKTSGDVPEIARTRRLEEKRLGLRPKRRGFPKAPAGYNPWTRRIERDD